MSEVAPFVYYRPEDYAPATRRILSFVIDAVVLFVAIAIPIVVIQLLVVPASVRGMPDSPARAKLIAKYAHPYQTWFVAIAFAALYHVALRRTTGGTVGNRLTGIRLVDASGGIPSWTALLKRFGLALMVMLIASMIAAVPSRLLANDYPAAAGPAGIIAIFVLVFVVLYRPCQRDPRRQTFHDRWSGTWSIRKRAEPAGPAKPVHHAKLLGPFLVTHVDIEPDQGRDREGAPANAAS
jgi:uncharacterized RDD family membrane protein YckC